MKRTFLNPSLNTTIAVLLPLDSNVYAGEWSIGAMLGQSSYNDRPQTCFSAYGSNIDPNLLETIQSIRVGCDNNTAAGINVGYQFDDT